MVNDLRAAQLNPGTDGGCTDGVLTAISTAVNLIITNKSPIYVITDAIPNDLSLEDTIYQRNAFWRSPVRPFSLISALFCLFLPCHHSELLKAGYFVRFANGRGCNLSQGEANGAGGNAPAFEFPALVIG